MSVNLALSRILRVSALLCAAVLCFATSSASPVLTQVDNGVKRSVLRPLYPPYDHSPPLPPETLSETGTSGNLREASSIIDPHQQFSCDNGPHGKRPGTAASEVRRGHRGGGTRPVSGIFSSRWWDESQPRGNYPPVNTRTAYRPMVGKSFQTEAGTFYLFSQSWPPKNQKPYNAAKYPGVFSLKMDEKVWSFLSHPSGGYWTVGLLTPRGRYSKEAKHQSSDTFANSDPSLEKLTRSAPNRRTQGSVSGGEAPTRSYVFRGSQGWSQEVGSEGTRSFPTAPGEQQAPAARGYGSISSHLIRFHYSAATSAPPAAPAPTQLSSPPASDKALESWAPEHHAGPQDSDGLGSEQPVVARPVSTARGAAHDPKHAPATKRLYGFRGFENPMRRAGAEPALPERYRWDENNETRETQNHSFQGASTTTQAEPEMTPTRSSAAASVPAPGSDLNEVWTESNAHVDKDQNDRRVRISQAQHGLEAFGSRPHEGADASVREPDESPSPQQELEAFELRSRQFWQPRGRWKDETGRAEHGATVILGFQPARNTSRAHAGRNPSTHPLAPTVSAAEPTPAGGLTGPSSEPAGEPVAAEARPVHAPPSSEARGTRVKVGRKHTLRKWISSSNGAARAAIVRSPKWPDSVTYADIVGSASFSRDGRRSRDRVADAADDVIGAELKKR